MCTCPRVRARARTRARAWCEVEPAAPVGNAVRGSDPPETERCGGRDACARAALGSRREAQYGWPAEDVWTESNWPVGTPWVKLLLVESRERERATLLVGVLVAAASLAATLAVQRTWQRRYTPLPTEPS